MTKTELRKQIQVLECALETEGMWIRYTLNNEKKIICADAWEASRLLEANGIIENYSRFSDDEKPLVQYIKELDDCDVCRENCWEDFIEDFRLSQYEAIKIVTEIEYQKHLQFVMKAAAEKNRLQYLQKSIERGLAKVS
jgi:hypothetical protein